MYKDNKTDRPACWDWEIPREVWDLAAKSRTNRDATELFMVWRPTCAVCDDPDNQLILDHDHSTWLIRGLLCESCNNAEYNTVKKQPLFDNYRHINPAYLINLEISYTRLSKYSVAELSKGISAFR